MSSIRLTVNGHSHTVDVEPDTPLLYVLRNDLDLHGPRFGCGLGQCGACTVQLDGTAVQSCDTRLWQVRGKSVVTVEALHSQPPHPLVQAFEEEQAGQCGYCLTGMLMSAKALLEHNPDPTDLEIRQALDSNLCRCGSHLRIVRAIRRAADAIGYSDILPLGHALDILRVQDRREDDYFTPPAK